MTKEAATAHPRRSKQRRSSLLRSFVILQTALLQDPLGVSLTTTNSPSIVASAFVRDYPQPQQSPHQQWPRDKSDDAWVGRRNPTRGFRGASSTMVLAGNTRGENEKATISTGDKDEGDTDFENMTILNDLVIASSLSYLSLSAEEETEESLSKMEASPYFATSGLKPLAQVVEPKTESGATVFEYSSAFSSDKCIVVACRGSATPVNFSTNLRFKLVPLQGKGSDDEEWLVHEGFQDATQGLWELLAPQLETLTSQKQSDSNGGKSLYSQIIVTGHSLGAANALLCAVKYQSSSSNSSGIPLSGVITFGGPRLVNTALAKQWNSGLLNSVTVKNYVHSKDPILRQNGPLWDSLGFGIVGTEVPCEPFEARAYHSPQEQQEYATKELPLAWNILDHCNYLGVFVGPRLF